MDKNQKKIEEMFDKIANLYDFANNLISVFTHKLIKKNALTLLNIKNDQNFIFLDLCSGTGDILQIVEKLYPKIKLIGVDLSQKMLSIAQKKIKNAILYKANCSIFLLKSKCDIISICFGLRNVCDINSTILQIKKNLKPNGQVLHLDFAKSDNNFINLLYELFVNFIVILSFLDKSSYKYLLESKKQYLQPFEIVHKFESTGFYLIEQKLYCFGLIQAQVFKINE